MSFLHVFSDIISSLSLEAPAFLRKANFVNLSTIGPAEPVLVASGCIERRLDYRANHGSQFPILSRCPPIALSFSIILNFSLQNNSTLT
jgi:hypothetical protein